MKHRHIHGKGRMREGIEMERGTREVEVEVDTKSMVETEEMTGIIIQPRNKISLLLLLLHMDLGRHLLSFKRIVRK